VSDELVERLTHINRFLEQVFGEPTRLSDILLRSGLSPTEIESIKRRHLEAAVDSVCEGLGDYLREVLPPKHAQVVAERFCLSRPYHPTLQVVADALDVSRERIRQLQNKGVRRLRSPSRRGGIQRVVVLGVRGVVRGG
jgi:DNA-directed RNA polymerase sigma subunit (sigma70/sigma32)